MGLSQVEAMLHNIAGTMTEHGVAKVEFVLHGGEPFLLPASYFRSIYALQCSILGPAGLEFCNVIQSNLTNLKEDHLQLLRDGIISNIGVSLDLFGDERVNTAGKVMDDHTLRNMERLADAGIAFGAISVLSTKTAPFIHQMFQFFSQSDIPWRILPIDLVGYEGQHDNNVLTANQVVEVYKGLFEEWLRSDHAIKLEPLNEYIDAAIASLSGEKGGHKFDKQTEDCLFVVNTNGDVYSEADAYNDRFSYGNIFSQPFSQLLASDNRQRAIDRAAFITGATCRHCPYYGPCNGFRMAESTTEKLYWGEVENISCNIIRPMIDFIQKRLIEENVEETGAAYMSATRYAE